MNDLLGSGRFGGARGAASMTQRRCIRLPLFMVLFFTCSSGPVCVAELFTIQVVDSQTGRGVPLVEVLPPGGPLLVTDSNGIVAVEDPALLDESLFFDFRSYGYGAGGQTIHTSPGGNVEVAIERHNRAERLYRVTGTGIYRDSVIAGHPVPIDEPLLNANVAGQDSVQTAVYQDTIYWFWGDTIYESGGFKLRLMTRRPAKADSLGCRFRCESAVPSVGPHFRTQALQKTRWSSGSQTCWASDRYPRNHNTPWMQRR